MSYAPDYTPGNSFADDETNNVAGRSLVKTDRLDAELSDISASINALNTNQQIIQRDDGKLQDSTVEPYALAEQTKALIAAAGCNPRGLWAPNTAYAFKDVVQRDNVAQISLQAHNSGTSFVQALWLPISGDGTSSANAAAAAASATSASGSEVAAAASATAAASSATAASNSAAAASTSATNASNSASSASSSASSASGSATTAAASAAAAAASAASITAPKNLANDPTLASTSSSDAVSPEWVKALALIKTGSSVTTNGAAAYDFSVPSGAKRFSVIFDGVSTVGSSQVCVRLGTAGGILTSGYNASAWTSDNGKGENGTALLLEAVGGAGFLRRGCMSIVQPQTNLWVSSHVYGQTINSGAQGSGSFGGGSIQLAAAVTTLRITTLIGTENFDGGTVTVLWEF